MNQHTKPKGLRGWHSRGYLPHFDAGDTFTQFVTYRLADSVPAHVTTKWQDELRAKLDTDRNQELVRLIEQYLDNGCGECLLRYPDVAAVVESGLRYFHEVRYSLHAWVVMPNHVHVLFTPKNGWSLSDVVGSWKSYTSKKVNKLLGRHGQFWQEDYFDRYIRDLSHFQWTWDYIEHNPVDSGLVSKPEDWPFGSARQRKVIEEAGGTPAVHEKSS